MLPAKGLPRYGHSSYQLLLLGGRLVLEPRQSCMEHTSSRSTLRQAVLVTHMRAKPVYLNEGAASNRYTKIVPHSNTGCLLTPSYCLAAGLRQKRGSSSNQQKGARDPPRVNQGKWSPFSRSHRTTTHHKNKNPAKVALLAHNLAHIPSSHPSAFRPGIRWSSSELALYKTPPYFCCWS